LSRSIWKRVRSVALAATCVTTLAACNPESGVLGPGVDAKALQPLSPRMVALLEQKDMNKQSPILVRIFKEEAELEVWKQKTDGDYELLKTYPICRWSGELGPKIREGDRQAPEGFYHITPGLMNPRSSYYLAFNLGYPNAFDRAHGRTGAHLMVHGDCSSRGCYSMTDEQIGEIFSLARESFEGGQRSFQVQAYPFRMTAANLARHRNNPHLAFWKMLKEGNDHFLVTRQEPKVDVCGKRYVFNAIPFDPTKPLDPQRACPPLDRPFEVEQAVAQKRQADEREYASLVSRGVATAPIITGRDGGMHPVFAAAIEKKRTPPDDSVRIASTAPLPGTIPASVRPPRGDDPEGPSVITASTPAPAATPSQRRPGIFSFARWFGGTEVRSAPAAAAPTPPTRPQAAPAPATRPAPATTATAQRQRAEPTAAEDEERPAKPATLPGATPILATGGFSFR
jgi:murein L,D-transpeptidase YafK